MDKKKLFIIGSSGHAKVALDIAIKMDCFDFSGFLDVPKLHGKNVWGYKVIGTEDDIPFLVKENPSCLFHIGVGNSYLRYEISEKIKKKLPNVSFVNLIHPTAIIGTNVILGEGNIIMASAVVNPDVRLGNFNIINTKASIDHECLIGSYNTFAPGVTTGGNVIIDDFVFLGIGCNLKHSINKKRNCIVGGGSFVGKDCKENSLYYGVPAKYIREHNFGENYL